MKRLGFLSTAIALSLLTALAALVGFAGTPSATATPPAAVRVKAGPTHDLSMQMRNAVLHPQARTSSPCMMQGKRPTDCSVSLPQRKCDAHGWICVHYDNNAADANYSSASWVNTTLNTLDHIYATYQGAGYRMPLSDGSVGGSSAIDIYLVDLSSVEGGAFADYYGYCTPTAAAAAASPRYSAFCVLDNDYRGMTTSTESAANVLQVTASHEFFHAVQFGYNAKADTWIMEATATWAESELYPKVHDNYQYLPYSPIALPTDPIDDSGPNYYGTTLANGRPDPRDFLVYGDWVFFRYLTEHVGASQGGLPVLVRQVWERMSATQAKPAYSIKAVAGALKSDHTSLVAQWAGFTAGNRHPSTAYAAGSAFPTSNPNGTTTFRRARRHSASGSYTLAHLTSRTHRFVPKHVKGKRTRLRISVSAPRAKQKTTTAVVSIWHTNGTISEKSIRLGGGHGSVKIPFASSKVSRAELTLGDANVGYNCKRASRQPHRYSCDGTPTGDGLRLSWSATLLKR